VLATVINWTAVAAIGTIVGGFASLFVALRANHRDTTRQIAEVKTEVKTANAQTIAQLADAAETRRVDEIEPNLRTPQERNHIHDVPPG
jgi:hypothetical protein